MPDDTTIADATQLLSPQLLQDAKPTRRADGPPARCAPVSIPRRSSPLPATLLPKPGASARHVPYAASAWPMRSQLMSRSASGAAWIHDSGAPCAGGWSGADRPQSREARPLRDPSTA
jgi:hypothetical protein